ncbi:MAG: tetratricopeptide repeat protein [Defluviicoccus sp.]
MRMSAFWSRITVVLALLAVACAGPEEPKRKRVEVSRYLLQVEEHQTGSFESLQAAAANGDAQAKHALGVAYAEGWGVPTDPVAAVSLWREAAAQDDPDAQNALAVAHVQGYGVQRDMDEALRLWRRAAEQGQTLAQYNLGNALVVTAQDRPQVAEGIAWLRRAADDGDAQAQFVLANLHYTGQGVARDAAEATRLWQMAAAQGHREAATALVHPERVTAEPPADIPFPVALRDDDPLLPPSLHDGPAVRPEGREGASRATAPVMAQAAPRLDGANERSARASKLSPPRAGKRMKGTAAVGRANKQPTKAAVDKGRGSKRVVVPAAGSSRSGTATGKSTGKPKPAARVAMPTAKPAAAKGGAAKSAPAKAAKARSR